MSRPTLPAESPPGLRSPATASFRVDRGLGLPPSSRSTRREPGLRLPAGWPLTGLLLLYPLWWVLGLGVLILPIAAMPMAAILIRRQRSGRPIRFPPGFWLWLLFLAVVLLGLAVLEVDPAGTVAETASARLAGAGFRVVGYGSLTVLLLYACNLSQAELPQRRLVGLLAWLFTITVAGGLLGTGAGHLELTSPVELLLPAGLRTDGFVQSLVHPAAAQIMDMGAGEVARPAAPWGYTNTWGHNVLLLVGWFVAWLLWQRRSARVAGVVLLLVALVPIAYSLNRGLWLGMVVVAAWAAIRLARQGLAVVALVTVLVAALAATPLADVVRDRLENGHSNGIRVHLAEVAVVGMAGSPVIGYGTTRLTQGGRHSIAIGPTPDCPRCGEFTIGGNGQLWQLLFAHGLLGTAAYAGFFGYGLWRFRRVRGLVGVAGTGALLAGFLSMLWYNALVTPLAFLMLSYALLWREDSS